MVSCLLQRQPYRCGEESVPALARQRVQTPSADRQTDTHTHTHTPHIKLGGALGGKTLKVGSHILSPTHTYTHTKSPALSLSPPPPFSLSLFLTRCLSLSLSLSLPPSLFPSLPSSLRPSPLHPFTSLHLPSPPLAVPRDSHRAKQNCGRCRAAAHGAPTDARQAQGDARLRPRVF